MAKQWLSVAKENAKTQMSEPTKELCFISHWRRKGRTRRKPDNSIFLLFLFNHFKFVHRIKMQLWQRL
jgi:hypothetical protein